MKQFIICILTILALTSCKSSKQKKSSTKDSSKAIIQTTNNTDEELTNIPEITSTSERNTITEAIVNYAKQFQGVKYKFGGTTKKGMDCSGLIYKSFGAYNVALPRISRDMAKNGKKISIDSVKTGDLLFFKTNSRRNTINHVGLIVTALPGNIEFIHSTSSLGVIISSLAERYWYYSFIEARRLL